MSTEIPSTITQPPRRFPSWLEPLLDMAVAPEDDRETVRGKRLLTGALLVSLPTTLLSIAQTALIEGLRVPAALVGISLMGNALILLVMRFRPSAFPGVMHYVTLLTILVSSTLVVLFGGLLPSGVNSVWGALTVLGAIVIFADRRAIFWLGFFLAATVVSLVWASRIEPTYVYATPEYIGAFNLLVVLNFVFFLLYYYVRERLLLLDQSESLLRNVLPDEIADRLKASRLTIAERFESASVLFADVVNFTPMSAGMSPEALVTLLDEVFTDFDDLVEERGLEKIKTIGDAYMVASGVPVARDDHARAICDLALAMMQRVSEHQYQGRSLSIRIGVNSGEVVAGIIGTKKFSYDLWGDTVNTASRMQTSGTPGRIQVTEATVRRSADDFTYEPAGTIDVKGKGPMDVWHLVSRRPG